MSDHSNTFQHSHLTTNLPFVVNFLLSYFFFLLVNLSYPSAAAVNYVVVSASSVQFVSGTSASAPVIAGMITLGSTTFLYLFYSLS